MSHIISKPGTQIERLIARNKIQMRDRVRLRELVIVVGKRAEQRVYLGVSEALQFTCNNKNDVEDARKHIEQRGRDERKNCGRGDHKGCLLEYCHLCLQEAKDNAEQRGRDDERKKPGNKCYTVSECYAQCMKEKKDAYAKGRADADKETADSCKQAKIRIQKLIAQAKEEGRASVIKKLPRTGVIRETDEIITISKGDYFDTLQKQRAEGIVDILAKIEDVYARGADSDEPGGVICHKQECFEVGLCWHEFERIKKKAIAALKSCGSSSHPTSCGKLSAARRKSP